MIYHLSFTDTRVIVLTGRKWKYTCCTRWNSSCLA